jgi:hypothetical protein
MKKFAALIFAIFLALVFIGPSFGGEPRVAASAKPLPLMLKALGTRYVLRDDVVIGSVNLCVITFGDTVWQDAAADARSKVMQGPLGAFALNAAHYAPNADGTWRMWNFRPATPENLMEWVDYIARPEVQKVIDNLNKAETQKDFGGPDEFIWIRASVKASELPYPLNRMSAETLAPVLSIFHYNEDGTMRIELRDPFWEAPKALVIFERMNAELNSAAK